MTTSKKSARQTAKWFANLNESTKDMISDIYDYIVRHENTKGGVVDLVDFTKTGVYWACANTSIVGRRSEEFVNRFYANLDHIKVIAEARPIVKVVYYSHIEDTKTKKYVMCKFKHTTFKKYDRSDLLYWIGLDAKDWTHSYGEDFHKTKIISDSLGVFDKLNKK